MRLIDVEPIERELFEWSMKPKDLNPYKNGELFAFLRAYKLLLNAPTIAPLPNDPLTLEELREMDGEPVWISSYAPYGETVGVWALVCVDEYTGELFLTNGRGERYLYEEVIVDIEAIYRRKPEEGTK